MIARFRFCMTDPEKGLDKGKSSTVPRAEEITCSDAPSTRGTSTTTTTTARKDGFRHIVKKGFPSLLTLQLGR